MNRLILCYSLWTSDGTWSQNWCYFSRIDIIGVLEPELAVSLLLFDCSVISYRLYFGTGYGSLMIDFCDTSQNSLFTRVKLTSMRSVFSQ